MSALAINQVNVHARGNALVSGVSLQVGAGEFVALLGPNGAGKTTLLRAALGLMPYSGSVALGGRDARGISGRERAAMAAWLPQQALIGEAITALELVAAARFRFSEGRQAALAAAESALEHAGAVEFSQRRVNQLSGGEQQRVAVAAMLAQEAPLLLLDEPANHLDPAQQISLYALFGRLWREGRAILCITHDINMLRHLGPGASRVRVVGMAGGRTRFETTYGSDELPGHIGELFAVRVDAIDTPGGTLLIAGERP